MNAPIDNLGVRRSYYIRLRNDYHKTGNEAMIEKLDDLISQYDKAISILEKAENVNEA